MTAPDRAALDALLDAHLSNLKSHQAMMRQMRDYVAGIQSSQSIPHARVAEELNQMNQRAEKILQDAQRAGELMEGLRIQDNNSPSTSNGSQPQARPQADIQSSPSKRSTEIRSKYDVDLEPTGNAAKRQRASEHPNLYMPAFPPVPPPFPNAMPKSFQSMRPSWHQKLFPEETRDEGSMQNRIIVANIPPDVQEDDLRKHFEPIGPITFKHTLRLPRLAETKIHGLSGAAKARYMATLEMADYQAANRAAWQLNGTRIQKHHHEPIVVRHFCAPNTTPAAGAKRPLSSDDSNDVSPSTASQSKRSRMEIDASQYPFSSTLTAEQPRKRQADIFETYKPTETASSTAEVSGTMPGKKARLDNSPKSAAQPQHAQTQGDGQQTSPPPNPASSNSTIIHPAYAASAQLALRSEFDDISNEVDRRLAEACERRAIAHKAFVAKARAGRKRKRSSFMSAATEEENDTGDGEYKPFSGELQQLQQTTTPDEMDEPKKKRGKMDALDDNKKRGTKRGNG